MKWVKVKVKRGGSYLKLVTHKHGASHLGGWIGIQQVAATCFPRGYLVDGDGRGLSPARLSMDSRLPSWVFVQVLLRLVDTNDVGWLEEVSPEQVQQARADALAFAQAHAGCTGSFCALAAHTRDITEPNKTRKKKTKSKAADGAAAPTAEPKLRQPKVPIDDEFLNQLQTSPAYEHLNVRIEFDKMKWWCLPRNKIPSRSRFINWLNGAERPMQVTENANGNNATNQAGPRQPGNTAAARTSDILHDRDYEDIVDRSLASGLRPDSSSPDQAQPST